MAASSPTTIAVSAASRPSYNPWHYVPVLTRKPGAMRNGAPFKDWVLPGALGRVRQKLKGMPDGDRQMVKILAAVLTGQSAGGGSGLRGSAGGGSVQQRRGAQRPVAPAAA